MDAWSVKVPWESEYRARLASQLKQLRLVLEFRKKCPLARAELHEELGLIGIDLTKLYRDPVKLGELLNFTVAEDFYLKKMTGSFSGSIYPAGFPKEETRARRNEFNKPRKAAQQRKRRADKAARLAEAGDLDCRSSAILALLSYRWIGLAELMKSLDRSRAYRRADGAGFLSGNSLRQAILRELKRPTLNGLVEKTDRFERHGRLMYLYRLRQKAPPGGFVTVSQ
jgi:hypothetical protein